MQNMMPLADIPADRLPAPQDVFPLIMEPCEGGKYRRWTESWYWLDANRTVFLGARPAASRSKQLGIWQFNKATRGIGPKSLSIRQSTEGFDILADGEQPIENFPTLEAAVLRMLALAPGLWPDLEFAASIAAELTRSCTRLRDAIASGRTHIEQRFHVAERRPLARGFLDVTTVFCRLFDWTGARSDAASRRKRKIRISSVNAGALFVVENSRYSPRFKGTKPNDRGFKPIYGKTAEDVYRLVLKHVPPLLSPHISGHEAMLLADFIREESDLVLAEEPFLIPIIEFENGKKT